MPPFLLVVIFFTVELILLASTGLVHAQPVDSQLGYQKVNNLRLWHSPNTTRVVFDVSANVKHRLFTLKNPLRLVVDIENADLSFALPKVDVNNSHIKVIRSGRPTTDLLRFVFELKTELTSSSFLLSPNELYGHRLVIDLSDQGSLRSNIKSGVESIPPVRQPVEKQATTKTVSVPVNIKLPENRSLLIAIDAGHGGEDPGATGYRGSREKNLTLSIAKRLKKVIDKNPKMRSFLVRKGDYYVKLNKRREMARQANADIFISIHADAFKHRSAHGFSVFALSQRGATSAMASALATKENASDLIGGVSLYDKDEILAKVLVDLSMTNTISESVNLGGRVLGELGKLGKLHSKRVEQAGFAVLKSADIPSILIETGFVTNPNEEKKLRSSSYQKKLVNAIYTAINNYYQQTPHFSNARYATPKVNDTFISRVPSPRANKNANKGTNKKKSTNQKGGTQSYHKVVRGDSLSKIAAKYKIRIKDLKSLNKLRNNTVVLGARLKIPNGGISRSTTKTTAKPTVHVVVRGDSLSAISAKYNITIRSIKSLNKLSKNTVYLGQKIKIPGGISGSNKKVSSHKVRRGDTLSEIAEKYRTSIKKIMRLNKMSRRTIMLGQVLKIPN